MFVEGATTQAVNEKEDKKPSYNVKPLLVNDWYNLSKNHDLYTVSIVAY